MSEIWTFVSGYDGKYAVSTWGRVKNGNQILKPHVTPKGYLKVGLSKDGKQKSYRVHRLVAQEFIPNPHNLLEVNHIDGNKQNNSVTNLEWVDGETNRMHEVRFHLEIYAQIEEVHNLNIKRQL